MHRLIGFLWGFALLGLLAGCAAHPVRTTPDNSDIEEAQSDMDDSKRDYESCLQDREDEVEIDCEVFKEIYEEDREAYEALLKLNKTGARR